MGGGSRALRVATVITRLEGGAGVLALRGAQVLDPEVVTPTIVTGSGQRLLEEAVASGIEVLVEPLLREVIAPRSDLLATRRLESMFREREFDVVHTHCAKAGAVGRMAAHRARVPRVVHTYHGFPFHQFQSRARRRAYVAVERRLGRMTDMALCVGSAVAAEALRRELIAAERVTTIGVAVDGPERLRASMNAGLPEARSRARALLGLPDDAAVVGAVGRLTYQKAPEDFIAAMREIGRPGVIGIWIGGGELADRVARQAAGLPPGVRVVLAGERADVLDVLPALDVFALPSRYEGLPTVIVEAMICGIPVVATAVNAVPDLVIPGVTGLLVPPRRPSQLAAAVRHLLDSPETAARLAAVARARVADQYGEPSLRAALTAAYAPAGLPAPVTSRGPASPD
ncbi:MAG TPA: glycosyltransferase [Streptosporangiaceae bacterium]|nr:glycosyltransferase [Streptosporangiaceae bacterium]